jgi:translation initiation factor 2 subunit 3
MSRQATLNVGTVGHVAHGKSTVVRAVSGVNTVKFRQERVRNITIRLGYANAKIFKCPTCPAPDCYKSFPSDKEDGPLCDNKDCKSTLVLLRHISFCDCPGHEVFLSTMLTGAAVMDAALLLIAANADCPQPQTIEHLMALEIMKLSHMIVLQNKIDIIFKDAEKTKENYKQIKEFMKGSICKNSPIIPISAEQRYNIDAVCESICDIPVPIRNLNVAPKMIIIRSFDVNKPGTHID